MLLHPVVHLHLVTPEGEVYLQKRVMTKDIQPGRWDTAVGGHVDFGETPGEALRRESCEELGHEPGNPGMICRYVFCSDRELELVHVFAECVSRDIRLTPDPGEIETGRFWTAAEIEAAYGQGILTPNFEQEYARIASQLSGLAGEGRK